MKKFIKANQKLLSILLAIVMVLGAVPVVAFAGTETSVSDKAAFLTAMNEAQDGDVVKLENNITIIGGSDKHGDCFSVPKNCLVTLDLNGKTLTVSNAQGNANNFGVGENSALIIKNGTINGRLDTNNEDKGILILSGVTVTDILFLGTTQAWIVNNCNIADLHTENGTVNPNATALNPKASGTIGRYNYANPAPAMVGSGVTWKCLATLQDDFAQAEPEVYKNVILLKDSTIDEDTTLTKSGINFNLAGNTLTINGKKLTIDNSTGTTTVCNGKIVGNIDMGANAGNVVLSGLTVTGKVNNDAHPVTIENGYYNDISSDSGKVTIQDGYYAGTLTGDNIEICGGSFVTKPDTSRIASGYMCENINENVNGTTYKYAVNRDTRVYYRAYDIKVSESSGISFKFKIDKTGHDILQRCDMELKAGNSSTDFSCAFPNKAMPYQNTVKTDKGQASIDINKTTDVVSITIYPSSINIPTLNEDNPYVWLLIRPCYGADALDTYDGKGADYYNDAVYLGKYATEQDFKNAKEEVAGKVIIDSGIKNGIVSVAKDTKFEGETVELNVTPNTGYQVKSIKYDTTEIIPQDGKYSFTMPNKDVTVYATFKRAPAHDFFAEYKKPNIVISCKNTPCDKTPVSIPVTIDNGTYNGKPVVGVKIDDEGFDWGDYGIPEPVTVYTGKAPTTYGPSTTPPTQPGTYTVTVTLGNDPDEEPIISTEMTIDKQPGKDVPTTAKVNPCTNEDNNDGKITGVDETMEYSKDGGKTWKPVTGTEIPGLSEGTIQVRTKETPTSKPGTPVTFEVIGQLTGDADIDGKPAYPETIKATIDDSNNTGKLKYQWYRDGQPITDATGESYTITKDDIGKEITCGITSDKQLGEKKTAPVKIEKADSPKAPENVTKKDATTWDNNNGKINGVDETMEYRKKGDTEWTPVTGDSIDGLYSGDYEIRVKETETAKAGEIKEVNVDITTKEFNIKLDIKDICCKCIFYKLGKVLDCSVTGEIPEGYKLVWECDSDKADLRTYDDEKKCDVTTDDWIITKATVTVKLVNINGDTVTDPAGNEIKDSQTVILKGLIFSRIIYVIRNIFSFFGC